MSRGYLRVVAWTRLKRGGIIIGLGLTSARPLRAEEHARLVYVRDESATQCPSEADLRLRVIARLGYDPFSPRASQVVLARIEAQDGALAGSVELIDRAGISSGKRSLTASEGDCEELARGLALSISLTLDPEREAPVPAPAPLSEATQIPPRREQPPRLIARLAPRRQQWFLGAAFTSTVGALPALGLGGSLVLGLRERHFSVAVEGRAIQSLARELSPRGELSGRLVAPGVSACGLWHSFSACLVAFLGAQTLQTRGVLHPRSSTALLASAGFRLAGRIPLSYDHVAMTLGFAGLVNLARNTAGFSGVDVWKTPPVSGSVEFGVLTPFL